MLKACLAAAISVGFTLNAFPGTDNHLPRSSIRRRLQQGRCKDNGRDLRAERDNTRWTSTLFVAETKCLRRLV